MSSSGNEITAEWHNGEYRSGEWVRVDPDEAVESGRAVDGELVKNAST